MTENRITDTFVLDGGAVVTLEHGRAFTNHWANSGFSGTGYLVRLDGAAVAGGQVAWRFDALKVAADLGAVEAAEILRLRSL